jgi:hypothetical protein
VYVKKVAGMEPSQTYFHIRIHETFCIVKQTRPLSWIRLHSSEVPEAMRMVEEERFSFSSPHVEYQGVFRQVI